MFLEKAKTLGFEGEDFDRIYQQVIDIHDPAQLDYIFDGVINSFKKLAEVSLDNRKFGE